MSEKVSEKSEMGTTTFCQRAMREEIAPPSYGNASTRIRKASRDLGWSLHANRKTSGTRTKESQSSPQSYSVSRR